MMRSLAAAAALVPVSVPAKEPVSVEKAREKALSLAGMMKELAGGNWRVSMDPKFILISKD